MSDYEAVESGQRPLGATVRGCATEFVVTSSVAERIELVLFDADGCEADHVDLVCGDTDTWVARVEGAGAGQHYGYRVHGPGRPRQGHACDPAKLLVDPAARQITGELRWTPELATPGVDSAPLVPRSVVVAVPADDAVPAPLRTPWDRTVIYEAHVGHLTTRHPAVPPEHRGRYGGLAAPAVLDHLVGLGVTAVELLPVQQFVSEAFLTDRGRGNVWGYNPLAWGAPHAAYASAGGDPVAELRAAVEALHGAGIEVWLDVVFNHTCEGSLGSGPILSWRGFDNAATYRLMAGPHGLVDDDVTGCGNAVDTGNPGVRRLIGDLLVRWVQEYGIDGFRFDLAATLMRGGDGPTADAAFLVDLAARPELDGIKLVAEPWDLGLGGYVLGGFPQPWRQWNDRFRDDVRDVWRGSVGRQELARALTGNAAVLDSHDADATVGINAVVTHDGFTLADLVTYDEPTDGHGQRSWNGGHEGPTEDLAVRAGRRRRQRALLATVCCAQGVPMILAGDELGRTQAGSANGYTLEPGEWGLDWEHGDDDLAAWTAAAIALRRAEPALRRTTWVTPDDDALTWRSPTGEELTGAGWSERWSEPLMVDLDGTDLAGSRLLLLVVPGSGEATFVLPPGRWRKRLDAAWDRPPAEDGPIVSDTATVASHGFVVLSRLR